MLILLSCLQLQASPFAPFGAPLQAGASFERQKYPLCLDTGDARGEQPHAGVPSFTPAARDPTREDGRTGGKCNKKGCVVMLQCPPKAPAHFHCDHLCSEYTHE